MLAVRSHTLQVAVREVAVLFCLLFVIFIGADVHVRPHEDGIVAGQVFVKQLIEEPVGLLLVQVQVVPAILFLGCQLRLIVRKGQGVGRHVNLRDDVHPIGHAHTLQVGELLLGIRAILGCQTGKAFALQTEGRISTVPIVAEELGKAIIIQVNLELVHLVERQHLDVLLQIVQGEKFTGHVQHEAPVGIARPVAGRPLGQASLLPVENLQQGARTPEHALNRRGQDVRPTLDGEDVALRAQLLVRICQRQIDTVLLRLAGLHRIGPTHQVAQVVRQNPGGGHQGSLVRRVHDNDALRRHRQFSTLPLPLLQGRDHPGAGLLCMDSQQGHQQGAESNQSF